MGSYRWWSIVLAVVVLIGGLITGCPGKQVKPDSEAGYAKPALEFRGIGFENRSFDGTDVVFKFVLISQDDRTAKVGGCPFKLELKDSETITGNIQVGELAGRKELLIETKASVPWPDNREGVLDLLARKRLPYKFHLTCDLETPDGAVSVSNADGGSIPLPKLPQMDVIQANAERFGAGTDARVNFELSMLNENTFKLRLDKIVYKVFLGETQVTQGDLVLAEIIPPSAEFNYDVATPIFNSSENKEIMEMLNQSQIDYRLEGVIHLGGFELPLDAQGTISFTRASDREE